MESPFKYRVGIIGHRSWIAEALMDSLGRDTQIVIFPKRCIDESCKIRKKQPDGTGLDCTFLFPGRAKEIDLLEIETIQCAMDNLEYGARLIYVGSRLAREDYPKTALGMHKQACDRALHSNREGRYRETPSSEYPERGVDWGQVKSVYPPAVFGPTQPADSPMLVPSLTRESDLSLKTPESETSFISIWALTTFLRRLITEPCMGNMGYSGCYIPGEFKVPPQAIKDLYRTWSEYRK
jgi:hypothetical protein